MSKIISYLENLPDVIKKKIYTFVCLFHEYEHRLLLQQIKHYKCFQRKLIDSSYLEIRYPSFYLSNQYLHDVCIKTGFRFDEIDNDNKIEISYND